MPLTPFQHQVLATVATDAGDDGRYLAGGAALHFAPQSLRYSDDLDFFHDSEARVAQAFAADRDRLLAAGFAVDVAFALPGYVRAVVSRDDAATRVDWARDSTWRFLPLVRHESGGWMLHPVDLAVNKILTLAGRDEPRDFVDALYTHRTILPVAGLCWAAAGKDPGLSPGALVALLERRGKHRPEEIARLQLAEPFDLPAAREEWARAMTEADAFARSRPVEELGCLYWSAAEGRFVIPDAERTLDHQGIVPHFGAPGGVVPVVSAD